MRKLLLLLPFLFACRSETKLVETQHGLTIAATPNVTVKPGTVFQTWTAWEVASVNPADPAYKYSQALADQVNNLAISEFNLSRFRLQAAWNNTETQSSPSGNPDSPYNWANDNSDPKITNAGGFRWTEFDGVIEKWYLPIKGAVKLNLNVVCMVTSCKAAAANPAEYAEFVDAVLDHLQTKYNLRPDYFELMLEPTQTAAQLGADLAALRARVDLTGIKIIGPSLVGANPTVSYATGMNQQVDEISYHRYSTAPTQTILNGIRNYAKSKGSTTSMLEHIGANQTELWQDLTWANVSAWQRYTLAGPTTTATKQGKLFFVDNGVIKIEPTAMYLWQYYHFIRPGDTRIGAATGTSLIQPVAFRTPSGEISVIAKVSGKITLVIAGLPSGTYRVWWTTASQKMFLSGTKSVVNGQLTVTVPAAGVVTISK